MIPCPYNRFAQLKEAAALLQELGFPANERLLREACATGELHAIKRPNGRRWFVLRAALREWAEVAFAPNAKLPGLSELELARHRTARKTFESRYGRG